MAKADRATGIGVGGAGGERTEREKKQSPVGKVTSLSLMLRAQVSFSEKKTERQKRNKNKFLDKLVGTGVCFGQF